MALFLGRSVGWFATAQSYRLEQSHSPHQGTWQTVHFSGGSSLETLEDKDFYTTGQRNAYRNYLTSLNITPQNIANKTGGLYLIDFILMGRTMHQFTKFITDWYDDEMPAFPKPSIHFVDINFSTNYRSAHEHEAFAIVPTQILAPERTMNPLVHARGENDIGKDHSLVCSFPPEAWTTWEKNLKETKPSAKALAMFKDLKGFLDYAYIHNTAALEEFPTPPTPQATSFLGTAFSRIFSCFGLPF